MIMNSVHAPRCSLAVYLIVVLMMITPVHSVWCYVCHSSQTPRCGDEFELTSSDKEFRNECFGSCIKRRGRRDYSQGASRIEIERSCVTFRSTGCFDEDKNGISQYSCVCNSNFCNSSRRQIASIYWPLLILVSFLYYVWHR